MWFVTGAQLLYGGDAVIAVDAHSNEMVKGLNESGKLPVKVRVYYPDADASGTVAFIETPEELADFYHGMVQHVRQCVEDGWNVKDSVDYNLLIQIYE